ncbi:Pycsar system effector family protein [Microbacterium soli]|uniref:Pycsar effector protein domain-containing protein n=1 Tax=Microbacterium soli TaxID=446075 RepID=A0ABP7NF92_9MICO
MSTEPGARENQMLQEARDDVQHADQKASLLLATAGVGFGVVVGGQMSSPWRADQMLSPIGQILWWAGIVAAVASVVAAAVAVWPRYRLEVMPRYGITYWGHVAAFRDPRSLGKAMTKAGSDRKGAGRDRALHQLWSLSRIVLKKYRWIRASLVLAGCAVLGLSLAVVIFPAVP